MACWRQTGGNFYGGIRRRIRVVSVAVSVLALLIGFFSIWLWYWQPPSVVLPSSPLIRMTLSQAIDDTTSVQNYQKLQSMSVIFVTPVGPAKLSKDAIIARNYNALNQSWYAGGAEIFYADVLGFPGAGAPRRSVWVVDNHELFPHSIPVHSHTSTWRDYFHKVRLLLRMAQPLKAASYEIFDASTGTPLGTVRTESGGF